MAKKADIASHPLSDEAVGYVDVPAAPAAPAAPTAEESRQAMFKGGLKGLAIAAAVVVGVMGLVIGAMGGGAVSTMLDVNNVPVTTFTGGFGHGFAEAAKFLVTSWLGAATLAAGAVAGAVYENKNLQQQALGAPDTQSQATIRALTQKLEVEQAVSEQLADQLKAKQEEPAVAPATDKATAVVTAAVPAAAPEENPRIAELTQELQAEKARSQQLLNMQEKLMADAGPAEKAPEAAAKAPVQSEDSARIRELTQALAEQREINRQVLASQMQNARSAQPATAAVANAQVNIKLDAEGKGQKPEAGKPDDIYLASSVSEDRAFRSAELKRRSERTTQRSDGIV